MIGANLDATTGFTAAQLYSTASYQAKDLHGIQLYNTDLTSWNFAAQNLASANFSSATLTGARWQRQTCLVRTWPMPR